MNFGSSPSSSWATSSTSSSSSAVLPVVSSSLHVAGNSNTSTAAARRRTRSENEANEDDRLDVNSNNHLDEENPRVEEQQQNVSSSNDVAFGNSARRRFQNDISDNDSYQVNPPGTLLNSMRTSTAAVAASALAYNSYNNDSNHRRSDDIGLSRLNSGIMLGPIQPEPDHHSTSSASIPSKILALTLNDLLSIEERRFPLRERPMASSIDWTSSSTSTKHKTDVLCVANEFVKKVVHNQDVGCIFFHSLEEFVSSSNSSTQDYEEKKIAAVITSIKTNDSNDIDERKDGEEKKQDEKDETLHITRSMALWKCEEVQKRNLANADCLNILMKLLPLYVGFPKYTFWHQFQGREMDELLRLQSTPQAERERIQQQQQQQQQHQYRIRDIYDTDLIISRVWSLNSSALKEECLKCFVQLRRLASKKHFVKDDTCCGSSSSSNSTAQYCRDFDIYTRTSCSPERANDILEYSVWNSSTKYQKFILEVPMAKRLFQHILQIQQRSDQETEAQQQQRQEEEEKQQRQSNAQEETIASNAEEAPLSLPRQDVVTPKLWQKFRP